MTLRDRLALLRFAHPVVFWLPIYLVATAALVALQIAFLRYFHMRFI